MKKIIAREFLFVLGFGVLVGLIYCTLLLMQYAKNLKVQELSRQAELLEDFQPYKYCGRYSEGDTGVYDDFKELYFDLRSYGITDIDESEFDIFAKLNCRDYIRKNKMDKLKALFESYQNSGLLSKQTTFEQFSSSDDSVQESLYNQGLDNKIISSLTDLELFKSTWGLKINEDLYELMMDGAFSSKEEFNDFISGATQNEIYSLVTEGAFESFEEFNSIFNDVSVTTRVITSQYNQFSDFHTMVRTKLNNEINRVRRKNPFRHFGILVLSLFSLVFLLRYLVYSTMWSVKQLKN